MRTIVLFAAVTATLLFTFGGVSAKPQPCGTVGEWRVPGAAETSAASATELLDRLARRPVVLLGEQHDSAEDHRWQLQTLVQLHARQPQLAVALEMFPRRLQPVLDDWVAGKLAEDEFLQRVEWDKVWGYDAQHYLPLFHFARMQRLPLLAINIERTLPEAVSNQGWDAVPEAQKEGLSRPAAPSEAYLAQLRQVFDHHPAKEKKGEAAFPRFVEAQTLWDRAFAQGIAEHLQRAPGSLVVGILGAGHVRHGHGVAHQLKALGVDASGALLTWDRRDDCRALGSDFADALFLVEPPQANAPRLGVATTPTKDGLLIDEITPDSVAASAGLQKGDVMLTVAGKPAKNILALRQAVQRQPPGTWLPITILRGEQTLDIVAKFPAKP